MIVIEEHGNYCSIQTKGKSQVVDFIDELDALSFVLSNALDVIRKKEETSLVLHEESEEGNPIFPSGLLDYVLEFMDEHEIEYEVSREEDLPYVEVPSDLFSDAPEPISLRDYQCLAISKSLSSRKGVLNMATGAGKTEVTIGIAKLVEENFEAPPGETVYISLTVVPSKASVKQIYKRFKNRGLKDVGRLGGGYKEYGRRHTVATPRTLYSGIKNEDLRTKELLENVAVLMFDECHHLGTAASWQAVSRNCEANLRFGFSGSPWASGWPTVDLMDYKTSKFADFRLIANLGGTVLYVPSRLLRDNGVLVDPMIYVMPIRKPRLTDNPYPTWKWVYKRGIIQNQFRNTLITELSSLLVERGHRPVTLVVSLAHGKDLLEQMSDAGLNAAFTKGSDEVFTYDGKKLKSHRNAGESYREAFQAGDIDALIGSVIIDESIDLPEMTSLILAGGMKSPIRAVQRIGRAIRTSEGKDEALVFDFRDLGHYWLRHHTDLRLEIYEIHDYKYQSISVRDMLKLLSEE